MAIYDELLKKTDEELIKFIADISNGAENITLANQILLFRDRNNVAKLTKNNLKYSRQLVWATWGLVFVTIFLVVVTFIPLIINNALKGVR